MRKRKLNPKIIRVGDKVIVTNPEFFDGCFYENNIKTRSAEIWKEHSKAIQEFIDSIVVRSHDIKMPNFEVTKFYPDLPDETEKRICNVLAYDIVAMNRKDGNKKVIVTRKDESEAGKLFEVKGIKFVHTGTYNKGHRYMSYDGEDYCPSYLSEIKVHKILKLDYFHWKDASWRESGEDIMIEAIHVEKVM